MRLKTFLSSILIVSSLSAMACVGIYPPAPQYHWIFYTGYSVDDGQWQRSLDKRFREENITFWHNYVGPSVSRESVERALYEEYLLNDFTENEFFRYLLNKKDSVALNYWLSLKARNDSQLKGVRWMQSAWWYPETKSVYWRDETDLAKPILDLSVAKVRELDEKCIRQCKNRDIRNRYVLQVIRKYFYTADYEKCISIWKTYGKRIPASALRTQCLNYYGGALLRSGRKAEAATVYAQIGYLDVRLHYDPAVLREVYKAQPNCRGFEFMVQQFVNQYFDRPNRAKANDFNVLAEDILREKKTKNPALWKSAQAALAYINQDMDEALLLLAASEKMQGSAIVKDNIRMIRLLFNSTRTDIDSLYEETLYPDLRWLTEHIKEDLRKTDYDYDDDSYDYEFYWNVRASNLALHRWKVFRRVVFLGVVPHFERLGQSYKCIAYWNFYNEVYHWDKRVRDFARQGKITVEKRPQGWYKHPVIYRGTCSRSSYPHEIGETKTDFYDSYCWGLNYDYGRELFNYLDSTDVKNVLQYVDFLRSGGKTPVEKYLIVNSYRDLNYFHELIGTQYLRKGQWGTAAFYLQKVSPKFLKTQNISEYMGPNRNPFAEIWVTKKDVRGIFKLSFNPAEEYAQNPSKLTFCQLMLRLRNESQSAKTAEERANAAYAYALGLYQSSLGYAWALENYYCDWYNSADYLESLPSYFAKEYQKKMLKIQQKRVDQWLNKAMKYDADKVFTLKCKILHSQYREKMKEPVKENYRGHLYTTVKFKEEVRNTFCDQSHDYDEFSSRRWRESAWCY